MVGNKPHITLQIAHSADGFIARPGERTKLSTDASWQRVYAGREQVDAIMVGINTVMDDNPKLTSHAAKTPIRVIADTNASIDPLSHLVLTSREIPTWLLTAQDDLMLEAMGVKLIECAVKNDRVDLQDAMQKLHNQGIKTLICEGGAMLAQSLNDEQLIDELILIESATTLGNGVALPILSGYKPVREEKIETDTWRYYKRA